MITTGLEIRAGNIRCLQVQKKSSPFCAKQWGAEPFSTEAMREGKIYEPSLIVAAMERLIQKMGLKKNKVAMAFPYQSVISKRIKVPSSIPPATAQSERMDYFRQAFPGVEEALCFDFVVLNENEESMQELLLFAAKKAQVDSYVAIAEAVGLTVSRVDIDVYALMHSLKQIFFCRGWVAVLFFDQPVQLVLAHEQEVIFSQPIAHMTALHSVLKMQMLSFERVDHLIFVGQPPLDYAPLQVEFSHKIKTLELHSSFPLPDFLVSFGLALRDQSDV